MLRKQNHLYAKGTGLSKCCGYNRRKFSFLLHWFI